MPCDRKLKPKQSIQQRAEEIRTVVAKVTAGLASGKITAKIGPTGGIAFVGLSEAERDGVTDNCCYRRILATGSALAKAAIAKAEALAGRSVDKMAVAHGHHTHGDGVWHTHK